MPSRRAGPKPQFTELFAGLARIGRHTDGPGCTRLAWTSEDAAARRWFRDMARRRDLDVELDRNGNLWAWWGDRRADAVVTGSHLDTVLAGGAYDGALGVVSAFAAVDVLRERGVRDPSPALAVVAFADEEGARFNTPTFGSGLLAGRKDPDALLRRRDPEGVSLADALSAAGVDPDGRGADPDRLTRIRAVVELHVEQGRHLAVIDRPLALCTEVWPRGRWRLRVDGEANHAGTTRLSNRADPMLVIAAAVRAARDRADQHGCHATIGKITVTPNGASSIPARVDAWLDARAPADAPLDDFLAHWQSDVDAHGSAQGCRTTFACDSRGDAVSFDAQLRERLRARLERRRQPVPEIPTAAGHDAAALAAHVPAAMLFVRNPTGVSHSPAEHADTGDCLTGVEALADALEELIQA